MDVAYDLPGKELARRIVVSVAEDMKARTILDLWGGGRSARAFREAIPSAIVTSAESDITEWPALRLDAQTHGYAHHFGDVATIEGSYDLIWLDFMGQAGADMRRVLRAVAPKVNGWLAVTIMPARENERLLTGPERTQFLGLWLERVTGMKVGGIFPYRRTGNLPMWLVFLGRHIGDWVNSNLDFIEEDIEEYGVWSCSSLPLTKAMNIELYGPITYRHAITLTDPPHGD
jgi:hypothetical protein